MARIRTAEKATGCSVTIMADLPGPKMRIGQIENEPVQLASGAAFTLTNEEMVRNAQRASMSFAPQPRVVQPSHQLFINDGLIQRSIERVEENDVHCTLTVGGELRSRKY